MYADACRAVPAEVKLRVASMQINSADCLRALQLSVRMLFSTFSQQDVKEC